MREENKDLREELKSSLDKPSKLVDRMLSMFEEYDSLRERNRELKGRLADYENAEKFAQCSEKEE